MNTPVADTGLHPSDPIVTFDRIEKAFFGNVVLKGVSFEVCRRRIVGLVGENGAGKSTLMNLLGGNLKPDGGQMRMGGKPYAPNDSVEARAAGIDFVHQELNLFPNLSVAENLLLTDFPVLGDTVRDRNTILGAGGDKGSGRIPNHARFRIPWIHRRNLRTQAQALLDQVGLNCDPDMLVEQLSTGECQLVEIARALGSNAKVLILDEPTTSLSARECDRLFSVITQLRDQGLAIIYISHSLTDLFRICSDLVVLRDGEVVGAGGVEDFTRDRLVFMMVGRQINQLYPTRPRKSALNSGVGASLNASPVLEVCAISEPGMIRDVSFHLNQGEVLGMFGLMGAGRSELARILFGVEIHSHGEVRLEGKRLTGPPRNRIQQGMAFLSEDRRREGLCLNASISDNLALVTWHQHARSPLRWLNFNSMKSAVRRIGEAVQLTRSAHPDQPVQILSGGNQQKVVLGKWLLAEPKVLLLDEPTRGIDVGARLEIYQLIHQLADRGAGILLISSDVEELIGVCDRILVMRQGTIAAEFGRSDFNRETLLAAALPLSNG